MVDNHSYSFFGQKIGLIIQSASKGDPYMFFRLIKCKNNGSWEKPSSGEGKIIKFSLEEMVCILRVISKEVNSWSSYHTFKDSKTQISFKWEDGEKRKLWIHIGSYSKVLEYSQITILEMLLKHILKEKIEFATIPTSFKKKNSDGLNNIVIQEEIITEVNHEGSNEITKMHSSDPKKKRHITGAIKGETTKALLIQFNDGSEIWVPKSTIHCDFNNTKDIIQNFTIDGWILEKNKIVS